MKRIQLNIDLPNNAALECDIYDALGEVLRTIQLERKLTVEEFDWAYDCEPLHLEVCE